ncbi:hypothetical protein F2Q69_00015043 [Brassica cretica]|uniref:Protein kinase domain-containing protein n=1 Tax=Brassica cretica TaxID=69181 RepID=A0A8S9R956_BRACR|nr:hypothetical protein F2Q69_00015043 [Brassica cretica]
MMPRERENAIEDQPSAPMDFAMLLNATDNFSQEIGHGGFGYVYKGVLANGEEISVKKLSEISKQGSEISKQIILLFHWLSSRLLQPSAKSPLALYFNDVSPELSKAELRYSLIHFWEARNAAKCGMLFDVNSFLQIFTQAFGQLTNLFPTGHCDARVHLIKLFSMIPASTQTRVHLQPHQFLHYKKQRGLSSW